MRTGSSSESPSGIVSSASSSRSASGFSSFCSSASSMPAAASSSKNSSSCSGLISSSTSKATLISSYVSEPWLLPRAISFFLSSSSVTAGAGSAIAVAPFLRAIIFCFHPFLFSILIVSVSRPAPRTLRAVPREPTAARKPLVDEIRKLAIPLAARLRAPIARPPGPDVHAALPSRRIARPSCGRAVRPRQ